MKRLRSGVSQRLFLLGMLMLGLLLQILGQARADTPLAPLSLLSEDGGLGREVIVLPIEGTVDMGQAAFVRRVVRDNPNAAAIVLKIDTFGGRVDAAVQIRDALLDAKPPVIAYIDRRAISAGALITYAADHIVFAPGSSMGAATPITIEDGEAEAVDEKMTSYMRAEMRATAEANGRRGDIAEAMVDRTLAVEGVIEEGKLLTVTTDDAVRIGLADGTADTLQDLLETVGLERAERVQVITSWAEKLARILTDPTVSGLLMSIGMFGLIIELYTPGFGVTGAIGLTCLALFFGGHMVAELAGWEETLMMLAGLTLLGIEIFIIPGFGIVGILGIGLIIGALSLSLVGMPLAVSWDLGLLGDALGRVTVSLALTIVAVALFMRFFPARLLPDWLVLRAKLPVGASTVAETRTTTHDGLVGQTGEALTDLRPSGKARIGAQVLDVLSLHEYILRGAAVRVIEVEGTRIVVCRADEPIQSSS